MFSLPYALIAPLLFPWPTHLPSAVARWAFGYESVVSMFLAFFAWYRGLALGEAGQVQLVQPVLTVLWSALLLGEALDSRILLVVVIAALSRLPR